MVVALVCGCGRIGFDARSAGSGSSTIDAPHLTIDAPMLALDAGQCPPSYMLVAASCYRVGIANAGWLPAELACEADAVGAHLVVIDTAAEDATVNAMFTKSLRTWIGLSRRQVSAFRTVIDTDGYRDLTSSQSENSEDCVALDDNTHMGTHTCGDSDRYVCEYDGHAAVPSTY